MSYFPPSNPTSNSTSQETLPPQQGPREQPERTASRHSISDPPEAEQADHRSEHSRSSSFRRRHTSGGDAEAQGTDGPDAGGSRPGMMQRGSTYVKKSFFADIRNDSIAMAGEFVGTILFLVTSLGVSLPVRLRRAADLGQAAQSVSSVSANISGNAMSTASTSDKLVVGHCVFAHSLNLPG
jgi:hypothetical protein